MRFTDDEWMLMMLYSPGTRTGLIEELQKMQTSKDAEKSDRQRQKPAQVDGLAACETGRDGGCRI